MIGDLTEEETRELLRTNILGRIGCNDGEKTYIVPVSYVFEGNFIIAHSVEGMKINIMRHNPKVCFEVDEIVSYTNWKSAIAWGRYQELTDERDRYNAMKLFIDKLLHVKISHTAALNDAVAPGQHPGVTTGKKPIIYRIIINEVTGKFEKD
jgi:uncharacterized protein